MTHGGSAYLAGAGEEHLSGTGRAETDFRRAIELNPNSALQHHWYGDYLANMGRSEEGLEKQKGRRIDPLSLIH